MVGVNRDAINRTDLNALGSLEMAHAFRASLPVDLVDNFTLKNGIIRAFRFTNITIDAIVCDQESH